jgi:hypothetical protein
MSEWTGKGRSSRSPSTAPERESPARMLDNGARSSPALLAEPASKVDPLAMTPPPLRTGPHDAVTATPARVPRSMRRTTSLDMTRPRGLHGPIVVDVRGQDIHTDAQGNGQVTDHLAVAIEIDPRRGRITSVRPSSMHPALPELTGMSTRSGMARRLAELFDDEQANRSLLCRALEDLSGALLVSGYALLHAGALPASRELAEQRVQAQADVCVGWASGGPLLHEFRRQGVAPLPVGPAAPGIESDDALGWHPMAPLAIETVRRRRRLDALPPDTGGGSRTVQSHFRDSFAAADGETVMHEYLVDATIDERDVLVGIDVQPRVLPWYECPAAITSAQHLVGLALDEIATRVRTQLTGATTCTHLNSTLRFLAGSTPSAAAGRARDRLAPTSSERGDLAL